VVTLEKLELSLTCPKRHYNSKHRPNPIRKIKRLSEDYFHKELTAPEIKEFQDEEDILNQFIKHNFSTDR